jgi:hypothetical protein
VEPDIDHQRDRLQPDRRHATRPRAKIAMAIQSLVPLGIIGRAFDEIFDTEGIKVIRMPIQVPNANAYAERCSRSGRSFRDAKRRGRR